MFSNIKNFLHIKTKVKKLSNEEKINKLFDSLDREVIIIQIGSDLAVFGDFICEIVSKMRDEIKYECGFILPLVKIVENKYYQENEFTIKIQDKEVEKGFLIPSKKGVEEEFYDVLKTVIYNYLDKIFTNELTEKYIDKVQEKNNLLIWNLSSILTVIDIRVIMLEIIKSGKSINNISYIFEQIGEEVLLSEKYKSGKEKYNPHIIADKISEKL